MVYSYEIRILFLALCFINFGCSNDDSDPEGEVFRNLQGTVIGDTTCNTENNGLAYVVRVDDFDLIEFIVTGSFPDSYKVEQLRVRFDMRQSGEELTICTADISPEQFYVLTNISTIEN